jgi:AcrR family transcriptional regulator
VPTGRAIEDVRGRLFAAAEHVLLRDGSAAVTSRAVTTEAGVAKGVLHRHFTDMDVFLTELVLDRIETVDVQAERLLERAGEGDVVENLVQALEELFGSIAPAVLELVTARDTVRARLREAGSVGVPVLTEGANMLARYLAAEQQQGRLTSGADVATLAGTVMGAAHLQYAGRDVARTDDQALRRMVAAVITGALAAG